MAAADGRVESIDGLFAANAIHAQYGNWETCLVEWRSLRRRHHILLLSIYNALLKVKDNPDIGYLEVIPQVPSNLSPEMKMRTDILVIPDGLFPVGQDIQRRRELAVVVGPDVETGRKMKRDEGPHEFAQQEERNRARHGHGQVEVDLEVPAPENDGATGPVDRELKVHRLEGKPRLLDGAELKQSGVSETEG